VLFCDLVGSTPLAGHLDPEDLREVVTGLNLRIFPHKRFQLRAVPVMFAPALDDA